MAGVADTSPTGDHSSQTALGQGLDHTPPARRSGAAADRRKTVAIVKESAAAPAASSSSPSASSGGHGSDGHAAHATPHHAKQRGTGVGSSDVGGLVDSKASPAHGHHGVGGRRQTVTAASPSASAATGSPSANANANAAPHAHAVSHDASHFSSADVPTASAFARSPLQKAK